LSIGASIIEASKSVMASVEARTAEHQIIQATSKDRHDQSEKNQAAKASKIIEARSIKGNHGKCGFSKPGFTGEALLK
jgi:hypothetical protein